MDFNSLEEVEKYLKYNPKEAIKKSEGGSMEIECQNCKKTILLNLPLDDEVECPECGVTIKIDFL